MPGLGVDALGAALREAADQVDQAVPAAGGGAQPAGRVALEDLVVEGDDAFDAARVALARGAAVELAVDAASIRGTR